MEPTFEGGLARLFSGGAAPRPQEPAVTTTAAPGPATSPSPQLAPQLVELADQAQAHYQRALDAQRAGDWAKYGEEIKALGQALDRMKQR